MAVKGQFLYRTDNKVTVMKGDTFETFELDVDVFDGGADAANLLTEGVEVTLQVRSHSFTEACVPRAVLMQQPVPDRRPALAQVYNEDKVVSLRPPETVTCTVTETVPSFKGQQASARYAPPRPERTCDARWLIQLMSHVVGTTEHSSKPAKVDTGATIHVPPYVEIGDKIVVNVQEQRFVSRKQ